MKKAIKTIIVILAVAILAATMFTLVACNDGADGGVKGKFTVQVLLPDGTPAPASSGIYVQLCTVVDGEEDNCQAYPVNDEGKVSEAIEEGATLCNIHIRQLPAQYKVPESMEHAQVKVGGFVVIKLVNA